MAGGEREIFLIETSNLLEVGFLLGAGGDHLLFEVVYVNAEPLLALHIDALALGMVDGAGHRREREGVCQDLVSRLDASAEQGQEECGAAAIQSHHILVAGVFRDLSLSARNAALGYASDYRLSDSPTRTSHWETTDDSASGTLYRYNFPVSIRATAPSIPSLGIGSGILMSF